MSGEGAPGSVGAAESASAGSAGSLVAIDPVLDEPVFREPWEAQAFAMTVLLHQQGLFTWAEWAQALSAQIAADRTPYYQQWLAALETLVASKGLSSPEELTRYQRAWEHAAHRTPHGMSIDLQSEDVGG
ncbi:MAG TPA: nitrile hydratase accessory protein [Steroidobacteraceae bacterium]|nr:nitrile hydratase accessory protein [Steroidobacteraceae bacterium]